LPLDLDLDLTSLTSPSSSSSSSPSPDTTAENASLAGDLSVISIADVLLLLQDQTQTGTLTLAKPDQRLDLFLRNGRVDFASARGVPEEFLLGRFLVEAGEISPSQLASVIEERKQTAGAGLLGAELVSRGLITPPGLWKAMVVQT